MNNITIEDLLNLIKTYNEEELEIIKKAYDYANYLHEGQIRESGEPYISHPLNVAYILAEMHADRDTICAALLHDTIEDTDVTKEEITTMFNEDVANLVDGVTKLAKMNFSTKNEQKAANTRKIITSITEDVRIIMIKLADRLHNMRTLGFKKDPYKQKENALETMEIFVPLAYYIGAYRIKNELEDLSLRYLNPNAYKRIEEKRKRIEEDSSGCLQEMLYKIKRILNDKNIPNEIKVRIKNIYGIYKSLNEGNRLSDIHDLHSLKVIVDEVDNCYQALRLIHWQYHPINERFKDYICNPKTNMYSSLHTTVFGPEDRLVQVQIRTFEMDQVASNGLSTHWHISKGNARNIMQNELKQKYQFVKLLTEMNSMFGDNQDFVNQVKKELFSDKVYVYGPLGIIQELSLGSTPIDYAYQISEDIGNTMVAAKVNGEYVGLDYQLKNKDRIQIITDDLSYGPREEWGNIAKTSHAKRMIKEFYTK